jgi:hypothetical protein
MISELFINVYVVSRNNHIFISRIYLNSVQALHSWVIDTAITYARHPGTGEKMRPVSTAAAFVGWGGAIRTKNA